MKNQQGMTFLGMVLTTIVIILVVITAIRIVPVYLQYYSVLSSVKALEQIPKTEFSSDVMSNVLILEEKLKNQLYVNGIEIPNNLIKVKPIDEKNYQVSISYQEKRTLVGNVSLLFDFNIEKEIHIDTSS